MSTPISQEREYDFSLVLTGVSDLTTTVTDGLFEAGCDDGTLSIINGTARLDFTRTATSFRDAVLSAIRDVRRAGVGIDVERVDVDDPQSATDVAQWTAELNRFRDAI